MSLKPYYYMLGIVSAMLFSGCAIRSVYIPLSQNVPLFDTSRQIKASGYLGINHVELQAAHNYSAHFALATNVYFGSGIACYDAAIGAYAYSKNAKWHYELFGGYGYNSNISYNNGNFLSPSEKLSYDANALYHRIYLQPAVGFTGKISIYKIRYSFSLSAKVSYLYFKDFLYDEKNVASPAPVYIVYKQYQDDGMFTLEPCLTNKVGIKNIMAILQVQSISPYSTQIDVRNTKFSPVIILSTGIQYDLTFKRKFR